MEEYDGGAALQPDHMAHMAAMDDLTQTAQAALPAASGIIDLPRNQLLTIKTPFATAPADQSAERQEEQGAGAAVLGQGASSGEQGLQRLLHQMRCRGVQTAAVSVLLPSQMQLQHHLLHGLLHGLVQNSKRQKVGNSNLKWLLHRVRY